MADIAPLGFAVDTKALADAASVAVDAKLKIEGVADAADKVGEATSKSADKIKKSTDAHKETAKAVKEHTTALDGLKKKTEEVGETASQQSQRIHNMVEQSLSKLDQQYNKASNVLDLTARLVPKNPAAQAFERSIEASAAKKMGPTEADIARQAKATKQTEMFRKEMERLTAAVDPAQAKLLRLDAIVEDLGKKFDAGQISRAKYNEFLDKIDAQEQRVTNPPMRRDTHHSFLGEVGRTLTYGIPRFGREARRLVYEGESEMRGGSLGQGLKGFATLAGGAAVGMLAVDAFRYVSELPAKIAAANDEAQKLERRLSSFDLGGMKAADDMADRLHISVKGAADAMVEFHNAFTRFAADQSSQDKVFSAAVAAGRIGGLDEKGQTGSAVQFAGLTQKQYASAGDITNLAGSNPVLAKALAGKFDTDIAGLQTLAATGQITGQRLFEAAASVNQRLQAENAKIPENAKELEQQAKDSQEKADAAISDNVIGFFYRLSTKINLGFTNLFNGDSGPGSSVTVKLPPANPGNDAVARALGIAEPYNGYTAGRRNLNSDLTTINSAIGNGASGQALETLKAAKREITAQLQDVETPFSRINDQVTQLEEAFGHGNGNTGLIGVWQQALQIQKEQQRLGHGVAGSLQEIVDKLIALKRAQQAIADTDEIKKLQQGIDATVARRTSITGGSYEQQVRSFRVEQKYADREHDELYGAGGGAPATATGGSTSLSAFLSAIRYAESRNRDFDAQGRPLRSPTGALFGMQVLPSTAMHPGYGIAPAHSQTASEYDRVGTDYATMLFNRFGGDASQAAAAYHNGLGGMSKLGPQARSYISTVLGRMGGRGGTTGGGAGGLDLYGKKRSLTEQNFFAGIDFQSASSLAGLVGDPDAFLNGGGVISGGSIGASSSQVAAYRGGAKEGAIHRLQLEQKITEEVKGLEPAYRAAYAQARRLEDAGTLRLKAEEDIAKLTQNAADNERRAAAISTGDPAKIKALELQLQVEQVRRSPAPPDAQDRQITALNADARSSALTNSGQTIGGLNADTKSLREQLQLVRYTGDELEVQTKLLEAKKQIEADTTGLTKEEVAAREANAEAIIRSNELLSKQLDLVTSIKGSYKFAIGTIGDAWSNMFAAMERDGHKHVHILLRGIEDGFYGMLDRIYQKLVISPLMKILDQLLNNLTNSIFGGGVSAGGGGGAAGSVGGWSVIGGSARGNVFGPRGLVPYATGGTGDFFNTPTRFAMGGGGQGIAGEGPGLYEAIMPLKRGPDGRLGVSTHGGGDNRDNSTQVVINDYRGAGAAPVEVQERETGNGRRKLEITLRDQTRANIGGGRVDADMRSSYGISRPATRR